MTKIVDSKVHKLKVPTKPKITAYPHKVIYFADPMFCLDIQTVEEEYTQMIAPELANFDIEFLNIKSTTDSMVLDEFCDVFFFDYGGMSLGNSLLESFTRYVLRFALDFPNRYYVMVSRFTELAMKEALEDFGKDKPYNIFLTIESFCKVFKQLEKGKV